MQFGSVEEFFYVVRTTPPTHNFLQLRPAIRRLMAMTAVVASLLLQGCSSPPAPSPTSNPQPSRTQIRPWTGRVA